jgi:hypothetical protein
MVSLIHMKKEISKILKTCNFKKITAKGGICLYLKPLDERLSWGVKYSRDSVDSIPLISYGILDSSMFDLQAQIEGTRELGLYSMTFEFPLNYTVLENGKIDTSCIYETQDILLKKISEIDNNKQEVIVGFHNYFINSSRFLRIFSEVKKYEFQLFVYYRLLYCICNGERISAKEIDISIKDALASFGDRSILVFRLRMLEKYLT